LADLVVEAGEEEYPLVEAELDGFEEFLGTDTAQGVEVGFHFFGPDNQGVAADIELFGALGVREAVGAEGEELVFY
jgi:hypothetical protein